MHLNTKNGEFSTSNEKLCKSFYVKSRYGNSILYSLFAPPSLYILPSKIGAFNVCWLSSWRTISSYKISRKDIFHFAALPGVLGLLSRSRPPGGGGVVSAEIICVTLITCRLTREEGSRFYPPLMFFVDFKQNNRLIFTSFSVRTVPRNCYPAHTAGPAESYRRLCRTITC